MSTSLRLPSELEIRVGGTPLDAALQRAMSSVLVLQALDAPSLAEIAFVSTPEGSRARFGAGAAVELSVGGAALFSGTITGVEQSFPANSVHELRIRAHDPLHALRQRRRFNAVTEGSAASAAAAVAADLGLGFAGAAAEGQRTLMQTGGSDLAFLVGAAADEGLHVFIDGDTLRLVSLAGEGDAVPLSWGTTLVSAQIEEAGERSAGSSRAFGWDPSTATGYSGTAPVARQDQELELRDFGLVPGATDNGLLIANRTAASEAQLRGRAQHVLDQEVAAQYVVSGIAFGDPRLRPGRRVALKDLPDNGEVEIALSQATHIFDSAAGYRTEFSSAAPAASAAGASAAVTMGVVTEIDDPEAAGRCRVTLPAYDGLDIGFVPLVIQGAGAGKGVAAFPDVGDKVVVLFPDGDLAHGLILGGLYGSARLPRDTTSQTPRALVIASGGGQSLRLGGRQHTLTLSTAGGDRLALGGGSAQLAVSGNLAITAIGGTLTFKASQINFERD